MSKLRIRHGWRTWAAGGLIAWLSMPAVSQAFFPPIFNPPPNEPQFGPPPPTDPPVNPPEMPPVDPPVNPPVVPTPISPPVVPSVGPPTTVPEPATLISGLVGLLALGGYGMSRRRTNVSEHTDS